MTIKFTAPLEPVSFKRVRINGRQHYNDPRYTEFKTRLGQYAKIAMCGLKPLTGAIKIKIEISKNMNPTALNFGDWDNHGKAISDALNGVCYVDDRQIIRGEIILLKGEPYIKVELEETL